VSSWLSDPLLQEYKTSSRIHAIWTQIGTVNIVIFYPTFFSPSQIFITDRLQQDTNDEIHLFFKMFYIISSEIDAAYALYMQQSLSTSYQKEINRI
jgi:hypothetical protein